MNLLTQYGVNANLSKLEFVDILSIHPAETLKGLRQSLFCEYTALDISSNDFQDIPLVARRDSALRPVQPVLSEDCWIIMPRGGATAYGSSFVCHSVFYISFAEHAER